MSIYAVNGKTPVAAWIPSRDDAGNGTTTLNDLVGSNNGTLTNFALTGTTSNWVADTGAGGIRALDFDGVNDFINFTSSAINGGSGTISISAWINPLNLGRPVNTILSKMQSANNQPGWLFAVLSSEKLYFATTTGVSFGVQVWHSTESLVPIGIWSHVAMMYTWGSGASIQMWFNGAVASGSWITGNGDVTYTANTSLTQKMGRLQHTGVDTFFSWAGKLDDIRVWNQSVDINDATFLHNGGNGRGRLALTPSRRRRSRSGGGVL
jgi:hypothetical protein